MRTKRKVSLLAVTALTVTVVFVLGMARLILLNNVEKNVIQRAISEASERAAGQAAEVDHSLSLQFDTLESLAGYIGGQKEQNSGESGCAWTGDFLSQKPYAANYLRKCKKHWKKISGYKPINAKSPTRSKENS